MPVAARMNCERMRAVSVKPAPCSLWPSAMQQDGVEAGITEEYFDRALRGGIATENGIDLFPEGAEHGSYL